MHYTSLVRLFPVEVSLYFCLVLINCFPDNGLGRRARHRRASTAQYRKNEYAGNVYK